MARPTADVEMKNVEAAAPKIGLYTMNPFPRKMFLDRFSCPELIKLSKIGALYFIWVRGYLSEFKVINMKPCSNKICLSREPCSTSNYSCPHRIIRSVSHISELFKLGLLQVDTITIQAPVKPTNLRSTISCVKNICQVFTGCIRKLILDVSSEKPYVEFIKDLLKRNDEALEKFIIRNSNVDESKFNFPHFLNRTIWTKTDFPMLTSFSKRNFKQKNQRQQARRLRIARQQEAQERLLNHVHDNDLFNEFGHVH
jgi:hypothetical protein